MKGLKQLKSGKETRRINCSETQGNYIYPEERGELGGETGRSCCHSGHGRVHIQIETETEHKAQRNSRKKNVDCRELSSAGGGRQGNKQAVIKKKEQKGKKKGGGQETRRNRRELEVREFCL